MGICILEKERLHLDIRMSAPFLTFHGRTWSQIAGDARNCPSAAQKKGHMTWCILQHQKNSQTDVSLTWRLRAMCAIMTHKTLYRVPSFAHVIGCHAPSRTVVGSPSSGVGDVLERQRQVQWTGKNLRKPWKEPAPVFGAPFLRCCPLTVHFALPTTP